MNNPNCLHAYLLISFFKNKTVTPAGNGFPSVPVPDRCRPRLILLSLRSGITANGFKLGFSTVLKILDKDIHLIKGDFYVMFTECLQNI